MTKETKIQKEVLMNNIILKSEVDGGLGYTEGRKEQVSSLLFHVPSLKKYHSIVNGKSYNKLVKKFGSEDAFIEKFQVALHDEIYLRKNNVATGIYYSKNSPYSFRFEGEVFKLFRPFQSKEKDLNQWIAIEELEYRPAIDSQLVRRPDITFFVNGIFFSLLELKHLFQGQSALDGVEKIITNYIETIVDYKDAYVRKKLKGDFSALAYSKIYSSAIHCIATDGKDFFMSRRLRTFEKDIYNVKINNQSDLGVRDKIKNSFEKMESIDVNDIEQNLFKNLNFIYSKEHIQDEIMIFNFNKYDRGENNVIKNNTAKLVTPRYRQHSAVYKILDDLELRLKNENNPNFVIDEERKRLINMGNVLPDEVAAMLDRRKKYSNDQKMDSYLLQYSAGFGKTYIMGWIILKLMGLLKNKSALYSNDESPIYDKIIPVVDRRDLSDQFLKNLIDMNINKKSVILIHEIKGAEAKLKSALIDSNVKIIIITVQSFGLKSLQKLTDKDKNILSGIRTAFVVDEVHRTQSGDLNNQMMDLFTSIASNNSVDKRNLLIGLTATPKIETLQNYGQYVKESINGTQFEAFDTYTMKEAIADGFVLNPIENLVPLVTTMSFDPSDVSEDSKLPSGDSLYEYQPWIKEKAIQMVRIMKDHTFTKLKKQGQSMLVAYSIKSAIQYHYELIDAGMDPDKVFIIFSEDKQKYQSLRELNPQVQSKSNFKKSIIETFIKDKQSIIIVVDMLQTGFDNPKLHTLFLDKVVRDISAVQLCCRVNRIHPLKDDTLIVDTTYQNKNMVTVPSAMKKYEGLVFAEMKESDITKKMDDLKPKIKNHYVFKTYFKDVMACLKEDGSIIKDFDIHSNLIVDKVKCEEFLIMSSEYLSFFDKLNGVIVDFKENYEILGLSVFQRILNSLLQEKIDKTVVSFKLENIELGADLYNLLNTKDPGGSNKGDGPPSKSKSTPQNIASKIKSENETSATIDGLMLEFSTSIHNCYNFILEFKPHVWWLNEDKSEDREKEFRKRFKIYFRKEDIHFKEYWDKHIEDELVFNSIVGDFFEGNF